MSKILTHTIILVCLPVIIWAQQARVTVTGTVYGEDGQTIPGVNVIEKGTLNGTTTNVDGEYNLRVDSEHSALVFSFIGYSPQEIEIDGRRHINVTLDQVSQSLAEVVVIGYGDVKKSDLTGSVSSVSMRDNELRQASSVDQLLQGKAAGVMITQTSGRPGGAISVNIRGNNSINAGNDPLYVIDGFPVTSNQWDLSSNVTSGGPLNPLATINPNDIESIEILKDASATAIYGARATNGVILITTRRGITGEGDVTLNISHGYQRVRKKMDMLNATQYAELVNEALMNEGLDPEYEDPAAFGEGTDWQDELFRVAPTTDVNLGFSGGTENIRYFLSTNYLKQEGIILNTDLNRIALQLGLDMDVKPWLTIKNNFNLSNVRANDIETGGWGVVNTALMFNPILPVRDENGEYILMNDRSIFTGNPVALASEADSKSNTTRGLANTNLQFSLAEGLSFNVMFGADAGFNKEVYYYPSYILAGYDAQGSAGIGNLSNYSLLNENILNYHTVLNEIHDFTLLAGFTVQSSRNEVNRVGVERFTEDILRYNNLGGASNVSTFPFSYSHGYRMLSYLGRINYALLDKYLFSLNFRLDGSSKFGAGNKYGFFPSFAVGWKLTDEEFMEDLDILNFLKVRASYGTTGNQEIPSYQSLAMLGSTSYPIGGARIIGYRPTQIANPDLKWETTNQFNIGVDGALFENRVQFTADYYYKKTNDLLLNVNLPISTGFFTALDNIGSVQNQGVELTISTMNHIGNFSWNIDFNIAGNRNKVLSLAGEDAIPIPSRINQLDPGWLIVGQPIGLFYGLLTDGVFQSDEEIAGSAQPNAQPGDIRYVDRNGDGVINMDDRTIIGNSEPKFFGGILNTFNYNHIELTIFLQGSYGNDIWNGNLLSHEYPNGLYNQFSSVLNRWTPDNTDTDIPRASAFMQDAFEMDRFVEDGSYLRLKTITIAYDISQLLPLTGFKHVKVYFTGENLLTFTNYSGFDPEVNYFGSNSLATGYDWGSYPTSKNFYFGVNLSF